MKQITYRVLEHREISKVANLHLSFSPSRTVENLKWQFFGKNLEMPGQIVGAFDEDRLVGTQAFIPFLGSYNNEELITAKSELTLIHPDYRGMKIFDGMYQLGFEICREIGISCIWGFTSAVKPFQKMGFEIGESLYSEIILWSPLKLYFAMKFSRNPKTNFNPSSNVSMPVNLIDNDNGIFTLVRNQKYLLHRYIDHPYSKIAHYDIEHGVLYSYWPKRNLLKISEVENEEHIPASLRLLPPSIKRGVYGVFRKTSKPSLNWTTVMGTFYRRRKSTNMIVFKWLDRTSPLPKFAIEEGYTEGF